MANNRFTQTHEGKVDMQLVNIPNQNQISTHNYTCKCEDDVEMDQTGIQYRSDFARRLQKSEVIPNAQPVTNYNSERPRQTESSTLYHIPQQSISHTPIQSIQHTQPSTIQSIHPPTLQYRQTHGIENMETDAIDYPVQKPLQYNQSQAITHAERPNISQTESSTIYHIPQESISHTQPHALQYTQQKTMHTPIQSIQPSAISYTPVQSIQNTQPLAVTNSQPSALQYDQSQVISHIPQAVSHEPVCTEYFCMVCMTYFNTLRKLHKHMERFHDELRQEDRGIKRGGLKDSDEHIRKRNKVMDNEVEMSGDGIEESRCGI